MSTAKWRWLAVGLSAGCVLFILMCYGLFNLISKSRQPVQPTMRESVYVVLTKSLAQQIEADFQANPVAGLKKHGGTRYRFEARIDRITPSGQMVVVMPNANVSCIVEMRSLDEAAKVRIGEGQLLEGVIESWDPHRLAGIVFRDGTAP